MSDDDGDGVLIVGSKPETRADVVVFSAMVVVLTAGSLVMTVGLYLQERSRGGPARAAVAALPGLVLAGAWPVLAVLAARETPRGTWRIDGDGIAYQPSRGEPVSVRWKDVERVRWTRALAAFEVRDGRTVLRFPLHLVAEPERSAARARLEWLLGSDFDLAFRPPPDRLAGFGPLGRVAWMAAVILGVTGAVMGSFFWAAVRYPARGSWQGQAVFFGWCLPMMALCLRTLRSDLTRNPTWRPRRLKTPPDDLNDPF